MDIIKKFMNDFHEIEKYYEFLVQKTKRHEYVGVTNEWLIDNFYLLVEHKNSIVDDKKNIRKNRKLYLDLYSRINNIVVKNNYNINFKILCQELKKYQKNTKKYFSYKELSSMKVILLFSYVSRLRLLCEDEYRKLLDEEEIDKIISSKGSKDLSIDDFVNFSNYKDNYHYIFSLNYKLRELGSNGGRIFKELNELLQSKNISLKEIINDEYHEKMSNDILISNIFNDLREFTEFNNEDLYEKISKSEKLFLTDSIYEQMSVESKKLYRQRLVKLAKKYHTTEHEFLSEILDKENADDYHVGFKLFKKPKYMFRFNFYFAFSLFLSCIITLLISKYFFVGIKGLSFVLLIIPVFQLFISIENEILSRVIRPKILPKLDFSEGIPDDYQTMVVIPTIVSDEDKIKKMFDILETFYIMNNKTDNLYFTLLGDVKSSSMEEEDYDKDISKYGTKYAKDLNKKYGKDLFYFIYRKRKYNDKEGEYLGYERKRGALLQFNKILLHEVDKVTSKENFNVNMLLNNKLNIKYVITLDTDTRLVLNTALNLVGAMAHPLNKPILNKSEDKVISGYGIMQPRVTMDIEDTNKSLYSQVFAGIGGFDTYTSVVPNVYQDSFGEGSFVGKGIYDLECFDKILDNTFPDNKVLSHDLLEGNYLRCAYISDIELVDGFPSKFLTDATRHHRWARGDVQIIDWLFPTVKNRKGRKVHNPLNPLEKYKILDNILRMFMYPLLLLIVILASFSLIKYPLCWIGFVLIQLALPIIFFLKSKMYREDNTKRTIYYKNLIFGGRSLLLRSYIMFVNLPYNAKLYLDAFCRTMYRMLVSHKNLLNWLTADDAEKTIKDNLANYNRNYIINFITGGLLIIGFIFIHNPIALICGILFLTAPFVLYRVSRNIDDNKIQLKEREKEKVENTALKTFNYFKDNLKEEYHYLIPDNYQDNREQKLDLRTSPTAIGFSMISIICGYELDFINEEETVKYLENILKSIDSLKKWHGHLYNWYNIETSEVMQPLFVSTVDSGNLVGSLVVVREFLDKYGYDSLVDLCDKLIKNTNFRKLYTKKDVFSIGYDENEGKLSIYNYNQFASESRLTSYLAIALGDVSSKHWFSLDKSLTIYKDRKGLLSWSGTAFEYFMPYLFMKNYPNTLLDETYRFAVFCNRDYIDSVDRSLPWGISESAYNELDNSLNYKYKAFATPHLKAKEDQDNRIVLSPYSSIMAMDMYPIEVYKNMTKFKRLDMYGKYGFYEAYDYDNSGVVKSYFAHHQGMILMGLTNYLKEDVIKSYFHRNVNIRTYDILLKEKVQVKTSIDMKMAKYKKYNYDKEEIQNDIRAFSYVSYMPEVSVLSNKKYCLLMNDRGDSFSRYRTLQLNRYRKVTEQDYGLFMYIKDLDSNFVWSNTFAPMNRQPDKYEIVFASDKIKYIRKDGDITTKSEIVVTNDHHAEIRKITFKNESSEVKKLELTTYTEVILSENMDDVSHRAFNSMFISTAYDDESHALIAKRKTRGDDKVNNYMFNRLVIPDVNEGYSYATERIDFIGRNHTASDPEALSHELNNYAGDNLDPIMSIRNTIEVEPFSSKEVYVLCGFGRSLEQIREIINAYDNIDKVDEAFEACTVMNIIKTKNMQLTGTDMRTFNVMLNYLYQTTRLSVNEEREDLLRKNALGQSGLWKFGVSGDRPIILVEISDINDLGFIYQILKCFEYYKNNSIFVDVIIINNESNQFSKIIKSEIEDELYRMYTVNSFYHTPGGVTVIDSSNISREEKSLLYMVPRLKFVIENHITLQEAVDLLQKNNTITDYEQDIWEDNIEKKSSEKLTYDNGYGGFRKNGSEYVIYNRNTPTPWSNIIANKNFGTIVTNNGCGFTYAYNSSEFKLTSWTNDMVCNDKSEGFKFNGKVFDPTYCVHGFGYSTLSSETSELKHEITEFVPVDDPIKVYLMTLTNKEKTKKNIEIEYYINPTFGNFEEKTTRHILTEFLGDDNFVKMRNVYSINYGDVNVFMSSNLKINSANTNRMLVKSITSKVSLEAGKSVDLIYVLGCGMSDEECIKLIDKYSDVTRARKALKEVKDNWEKDLSVVTVKSQDKSFDYMMNGWYLYQTISSRIFAKSGFYQVSGAFGYRDQLQDAMNIVMIKPDYTRSQILTNASHQFMEGDVLHWWHEKNRFGLRSRFKDDYLWLVYATISYIKVTGDTSILDEEVPYIIGDSLSEYENEKGIVFNYSQEKAKLFDHLVKSIDLSMNSLGRHKLPLMGGGDWNDGMNKVGIKGEGESVWLGFFLYEIIDDFVKMCKKSKNKIDTDKYLDFNDKLKDSLDKKAWDGNWYLRAYFDNGDKLGSHENSECKIDLLSQSFSILSGVANKDRREQVINSVEENLVDTNSKIIKLLTPAFAKSLNNPGYIMDYPKGIRENGGQYTHSVSWYLKALIKSGYFDKAYRYYQMINPVERSLDKTSVQKYLVEPYVIAADIYSALGREGRGGWTWYTGSAGWFYRLGIVDILGLQKSGDSLKLSPNMPVHWDNFRVIYRYMDTKYNIEVIKTNKDELVVDGRKQNSNNIILVNDKIDHEVTLYVKK